VGSYFSLDNDEPKEIIRNEIDIYERSNLQLRRNVNTLLNLFAQGCGSISSHRVRLSCDQVHHAPPCEPPHEKKSPDVPFYVTSAGRVPPRCAHCHRPLTGGPDPAGSLAYGTVQHAGRHVHLCHAGHAPTAGGVYVVVPVPALGSRFALWYHAVAGEFRRYRSTAAAWTARSQRFFAPIQRAA